MSHSLTFVQMIFGYHLKSFLNLFSAHSSGKATLRFSMSATLFLIRSMAECSLNETVHSV